MTSIASHFSGRLLAAATTALAIAAAPAVMQAQVTEQASAPTLQTVAYSSSNSGSNPFAGEDIDGRSLSSTPNGNRAIAPQYGGGYGGGKYHQYSDQSAWSHFAFEAGGGFTAPLGNDQNGGFTSLIGNGQNYGTITWGGNFMVGAGWNFTKKFGVLGEFSYNDNKIPGRTLSAVYNGSSYYASNGVVQLGGNVHTLGVTAEPIYYYLQNDKHSYSAYVIGGGGFYHKSTNFTTPVQQCSYFYGYCGYQNQTISSFTDNSLGFNLGTGVSIRPFGQYSRAKLFAEARYVFVDSPRYNPASTTGNAHTGTEELIPVTVGIRF